MYAVAEDFVSQDQHRAAMAAPRLEPANTLSNRDKRSELTTPHAYY
jgi:hypothetical protein